MLSEALQQEEKCFYFACRAAPGSFDDRFVLEEEIFWVGVSVKLRDDCWVEAWGPWELFELCRERRAKALLWMMLMWHYIFAFLFI